MAYRRIQVTQHPGATGAVSVVRFTDRRVIDAQVIQELGEELFALVDKDNHKTLLLSFATVDFLSSAALNKLIMLAGKVKAAQGKLRLSGLKPEIREVFEITKLTKLFDIKNDESDALKDW